MNRRTSRGSAGYTLFELLVAVTLSSALLGVIIAGTQTTNALVEGSRREMLAAIDHAKALDALADLLRGAQYDSLNGFDGKDIAEKPEFERVTGGKDGEPVLGGTERLEWRANGDTVDGVTSPGGVWWVDANGDSHLVAEAVAGGGFSVKQSGRDLTIRLTTYYAHGRGEVLEVASDTSVALRN